MNGQPPIRIRPMTEEDLPDVLRIERATFAVPWTPGTFMGLLRRVDAHVMVAEAELEAPVGEAAGAAGTGFATARRGVLVLVGYAAVWAVLDQAELGNIAVDEGWRGRGIGQRLLDDVLARVSALGVRELYLEVRTSNTAAQSLYRRNGFREVGRRRNYYSRPREDALVLRRLVEAPRVALERD